MANKFKIRKIHRYLSIFIAIQLLLWTVSGIYFAFNKIEMVRGEQYRLPLETEYRIFKRLIHGERGIFYGLYILWIIKIETILIIFY